MDTDFKTTSSQELSILDVINSVSQLDAVNLRQIFLLLLRNFYANPKAFNADGTIIPESYYRYTYSDGLVDPKNLNPATLRIELGYSSAENSIDKTDYLDNNQKPSIYVDVGDFTYEPVNVLDSFTDRIGDTLERAVNVNTSIAFSHYANNYDDAAKLCSLTTNYFTGMKNYIQSNLKAITFMPATMKSPVPQINSYSESAQKYFMSQAIFNLKFESNWRVNPEAVLIKKFTLKLNNLEPIILN